MMNFLLETDQISRHQHGFRPRRSCSTQLLETIDEWSRHIEDGEPLDTIYLDFRKAFDAVPHQRLLRKLQAYGIEGNVFRWIAAFLSESKQQVLVGGCHSQWSPARLEKTRVFHQNPLGGGFFSGFFGGFWVFHDTLTNNS